MLGKPMFDNAQASCLGVDTELFFIDERCMASEEKRYLTKLCLGCPSFFECKNYALNHLVEGWWAATSFSERKRLRKQLGIKAQSITEMASDLCRSETPDAIKKRKSRQLQKEAK